MSETPSTKQDIPHQRFNVGGIHTAVYNLPAALASDLPVTVLFVAHGRFGHQFDDETKDTVRVSLRKLDELEKESGVRRSRELVIVTLVSQNSSSVDSADWHVQDQRNHGERKMTDIMNEGFDKNDRHA
jgi:hypothetical protein